MDFLDPYLKDVSSLLNWLSKFETNITALQVLQGIAAVLAIILSIIGIHKAWRFAERRLGDRLIEYLNIEDAKLAEARGVARAIRDQRSTRGLIGQALFSNHELQRALRVISRRAFNRGKNYEAAEMALEEALDASILRSKVAHEKLGVHERQRAAAHLLLGALADARGKHQSALGHFLQALDLNEQDVEALEYAGHQHLKLGNADQALALFLRLKEIARSTGNALLLAQAARSCGQAHQKDNALGNANQQYLDAINSFPPNGPQLELAYIYELKGLVGIDLNFHVQAYDCLMQALARYVAHERAQRGDTPTEASASERVIAALNSLQQARQTTADGDGLNGNPPASPN
jgi:tetratricopeptide (TPR) repeat protein